MNTIDVDATILRGAVARWFCEPPHSNPYPDAPGHYVLHKAWRYGYKNSETILAELDNLDAITAGPKLKRTA